MIILVLVSAICDDVELTTLVDETEFAKQQIVSSKQKLQHLLKVIISWLQSVIIIIFIYSLKGKGRMSTQTVDLPQLGTIAPTVNSATPLGEQSTNSLASNTPFAGTLSRSIAYV